MKFSEEWKVLGFYERFEKVVCLILSFFVALVIASALYKLGFHLIHMLISNGVDPLEA